MFFLSFLPSLAVFLVSLIVLSKASHTVLKSVINLSKHLGIGEFAVAFILVSVATSLPELMVSVMAGLSGNTGIILGNVIGSNITNKLLVLGVVAFLQGIPVTQKAMSQNAGILFIISLIPLLLIQRNSIGLIEGIVLISIFFAYAFIVSKMKISLEMPKHVFRNPDVVKLLVQKLEWFSHMVLDIILFCVGMVFVIGASYFMIQEATTIALAMNLSETVIGLTVVALGTSLPELSIAVVAVIKKHKSIALGEILGSSIVNLTLVLGAGAVLAPISIEFNAIGPAITLMIIVTLYLWFALNKYHNLGKKTGILFLLAYALFILSQTAGLL
ncbi:MAG: sodium:calcium antiporter [Candidatus Diapherotrites archaeon]